MVANVCCVCRHVLYGVHFDGIEWWNRAALWHLSTWACFWVFLIFSKRCFYANICTWCPIQCALTPSSAAHLVTMTKLLKRTTCRQCSHLVRIPTYWRYLIFFESSLMHVVISTFTLHMCVCKLARLCIRSLTTVPHSLCVCVCFFLMSVRMSTRKVRC